MFVYLKQRIKYFAIKCQELEKCNRFFCSSLATRDVILFPGQGNQFVGMTKKLKNMPAAKRLFQIANQILGYNLLELCLCGPQTKLDRTEYCQPAIFTSSLAALEKYKELKGENWFTEGNIATAGFSVGEIAALVLANVLSFEDGLSLIDVRGKAMQQASDKTSSGMVAISGLEEEEIRELLNEVRNTSSGDETDIEIASYLYKKGFVVAGGKKSIDRLMDMEKHSSAKMSQLPVSGAFHTQYMMSAQRTFADALEKIDIKEPQIDVYSNVTGEKYESARDIRRLLSRHIAEPVQWTKIMERLRGAKFKETTYYEVGPGRQLCTILAKSDRRLSKKSRSIGV